MAAVVVHLAAAVASPSYGISLSDDLWSSDPIQLAAGAEIGDRTHQSGAGGRERSGVWADRQDHHA